MRQLLLRLRPVDATQWVFLGFLSLLLLGGTLAVLLQMPALVVPALLVIPTVLVLTRWQWLYYGVFLLLPFSHEINLPGGLSMDIPSEPLMLALMVCVPIALLLGPGSLRQIAQREWLHPLLLIPVIMLGWSAVDSIFSTAGLKSAKYLLAKCWYLIPFLLGSLLLLRRPADFWRVAACYVSATVVGLGWILPRHASVGFSFAKVNWAIQPLYLNHVIYATALALLLPLAWGLALRATTLGQRRWWQVAAGIIFFGLLTSYTRASLLSLPVAWFFYWAMQRRLAGTVLLTLALSITGISTYLVTNDNFMKFAPDYEKTTWHGGDFLAHLQSTYKMRDVSGMERVYRWVAAARMVDANPVTGTGPSTFYPEYKRYTIKSFRTYVSNNVEHSTAHNYFLLQMAEQGVPGFLLFCTLIAVTMMQAQLLYHASAGRPEVRRIVLAITMTLVIIVFHLFLNELIEVDKIGSVFFVSLAMLIRCGTWLEESPAVFEQQNAAQAAD